MRVLVVLLASLILLGSCKARKVAMTKKDSTVTVIENKSVSVKETKIDTGKVVSKKETTKSDTGKYLITITPDSGVTFAVKNGIYIGTGKKVTISGVNGFNEKSTQLLIESKGYSEMKIADSVTSKNSKTHVESKTKNTETKPDYSWIWWVGGGLLLVLIIYMVYKKVT